MLTRVALALAVLGVPLLAGGPAPAAPEPGTIVIMGAGAVVVYLVARKRRKH